MLRIVPFKSAGYHILPKNSNPVRDCRSVENVMPNLYLASRQGRIPDGMQNCVVLSFFYRAIIPNGIHFHNKLKNTILIILINRYKAI